MVLPAKLNKNFEFPKEKGQKKSSTGNYAVEGGGIRGDGRRDAHHRTKITQDVYILKEILGRNMTYYIVIATNDDIFIIPGFLFQHLTLSYLQTSRNPFYHLIMFNV
jgi:hypothetical protein